MNKNTYDSRANGSPTLENFGHSLASLYHGFDVRLVITRPAAIAVAAIQLTLSYCRTTSFIAPCKPRFYFYDAPNSAQNGLGRVNCASQPRASGFFVTRSPLDRAHTTYSTLTLHILGADPLFVHACGCLEGSLCARFGGPGATVRASPAWCLLRASLLLAFLSLLHLPRR